VVHDEDRRRELAALVAAVGRLAKRKVLSREHVERVASFGLGRGSQAAPATVAEGRCCAYAHV